MLLIAMTNKSMAVIRIFGSLCVCRSDAVVLFLSLGLIEQIIAEKLVN